MEAGSRNSRTDNDLRLTEPREHGVVLLRDVFGLDPLIRLLEAARRCFQSIDTGRPVPETYRFSRPSHSVILSSLLNFGCETEDDLLAPLSAQGVNLLFSSLLVDGSQCSLQQSWARKKFAPKNAPASGYHLQNWHQDGALGVCFPPQPGPVIPMTDLLTCWIPLQACGVHSPGL